MRSFPAPDEAIWVGILRIAMTLPTARSRKDKRKVISRFRHRIPNRYNVSVAEVGHVENLNRSVIAVGMIGNDSKSIETALNSRFNEALTILDARIDEYSVTLSPYSSSTHWTQR